MQFSKCRLKLDVVSAFSLCPRLQHVERLLSTLVANVARVALSLTYFGRWALFSAQFWTSGIHVFWCTATIGGPILDIWNSCFFGVQQPSELSVEERNLLSGANKFPSCWCWSISVHVPSSFCCCGLQPVYTARRSSTDE